MQILKGKYSMTTLIDKKAAEITEQREKMVDAEGIDQLRNLTRPYRLSDAIREGASVSGQAFNWTDAQGNMCALSAAVAAARSRNYL